MFSVFSEYFNVATRVQGRRMSDAPRSKCDDRGRWRANPRWRDLPEEF